MPQRKVSRMVLATIILVELGLVGFWGYLVYDPGTPQMAQITRTRAALTDGGCTFSAAVTLRRRADQWVFARREGEVRQALVAVLRTKSRYMVSNPTAREALRRQMLREVNRVMDEPVAEEVRLTEFVLS